MADENGTPGTEATAEEAPKKPLLGKALILMANGGLSGLFDEFGLDDNEWQCVVQTAVWAMSGYVPEGDREELAITLIDAAVKSDFADYDDGENVKNACVKALQALGQEESIKAARSALDEGSDDYDYDDAVKLVKGMAEDLGIELDEDGGADAEAEKAGD
jgi:hypothetical protein